MTMVNHPNRSKRLDKDTRLVQARAAEFEAKRQAKAKLSDMTGYEADEVMIVQGEEYETLKTLNAELLAALKGMMEWAQRVQVRVPGMEPATAAAIIAKCDGR